VRAGNDRHRRTRALLGAVIVLASTAGCGFLQDLAQPDEAPSIPVADPVPADTPSAPATGPVVIAEGDLRTASGGEVGRVTVTVGPAQTGFVPPVPNFSDSCPVDGPSLQYVPVDVGFTTAGSRPSIQSGLAARLDVSTGPATPADIGDVGIVVESGDGTERYCFGYPPLPTADRFWNQMGAPTVTGFVVLDDAVTSATPDGRADVFPTLRLRISDLRVFTDPERVRPLTVGEMAVGAACPDDPEAICVPLS
jgi:hypothetical protein